MTTAPRCRCCGFPFPPMAEREAHHEAGGVRVGLYHDLCTYCDGRVFGGGCAGRHGVGLENGLAAMVRGGQCTLWEAIGTLAADDARVAGALAAIGTPCGFLPWITRAPRRWEVYLGRCSWAGIQPSFEMLCRVALERWIGERNTPEVRAAIANDLSQAAHAWRGDVVALDVALGGERVAEDQIEITVSQSTHTDLERDHQGEAQLVPAPPVAEEVEAAATRVIPPRNPFDFGTSAGRRFEA